MCSLNFHLSYFILQPLWLFATSLKTATTVHTKDANTKTTAKLQIIYQTVMVSHNLVILKTIASLICQKCQHAKKEDLAHTLSYSQRTLTKLETLQLLLRGRIQKNKEHLMQHIIASNLVTHNKRGKLTEKQVDTEVIRSYPTAFTVLSSGEQMSRFLGCLLCPTDQPKCRA